MAVVLGTGEIVGAPTRRTLADGATLLATAAVTSVGAGAVHAVAAGQHQDHRWLAGGMVAAAVGQIAWGALALRGAGRRLLAAGALGNALAVAAWLVTRVAAVPAVPGLEAREALGFIDGTAAGLAAVAAGLALALLLGPSDATAGRARLALPALLVAALAVPAMVARPAHDHDAVALADGATAADGHSHATSTGATSGDGTATQADGSGGTGATTVAPEPTAVVPPTPYDPELPIDLSGVEGVTPQQQARAENLIALTLARLPHFADPAVAEAAGFRSIGDGFTGYEHYINWAYINDEHTLDPDYPESLVYRVENGTKTLVSAMFMLADGETLETVPDVGGRLTQWHVHNNLCFSADPASGAADVRVAGLTNLDGTCTPPTVKLQENPMLHVWIVPHECGPFAALEGVAAGQVLPGETRWCDHAHGA
jgi:hypothetical protein